MGTHWHDHVDLGTDTFDQTANFGQIAGHVKCAIHWPQNIDAWFCALVALCLGGHAAFGHAKFGKQPRHGAISGLPLIFVDGAGQEPLDIGALGRYAAANHFGN